MERNEQGLPDGEGVMKEAVEVRSDKKLEKKLGKSSFRDISPSQVEKTKISLFVFFLISNLHSLMLKIVLLLAG